jgi:hypothetical protein
MGRHQILGHLRATLRVVVGWEGSASVMEPETGPYIRILGHNELCIGRCRALKNGGVHGRQKRCPVGIGRVDTVVDDSRILAHLACESLVGSIAFHDFDALRGRCSAATIDQANALSLPVEFVHHSETNGCGAKDDMQFILRNHRVLIHQSRSWVRFAFRFPVSG